MKIPTTLTVAAALAVATVTVAGCTTAAPSPTPPTFSTPAAPGSAVAEYQKERDHSVKREMEVNAAARLPAGVDRGLAEAAVQDGVPLVFEIEAGSDACGQVLRLPDRSLWGLSTGGALTPYTDLKETLVRWKGALPAYACHPGTVTTVPPFDAAAADTANRSGVPYRWREDCHTFVRIPGSDVRFTVPTTLTIRGEALRDGVGGCDGLPLPGQTTAPKGN